MYTYDELIRKYPEFVFKSYSIEENADSISVAFDMEISGLASFRPEWVIPKPAGKSFAENGTFRRLIFSLGMTELVSYWKIACPPKVKVLCGRLTDEQVSFWKQLYYSGLGEFFYKNGITVSIEDFMEIESFGEEPEAAEPVSESMRCLVPIGGGKDSVVTLETLRENAENISCFMINPRGATTGCAKLFGCPEERVIAFHRTLDRNMLELNRQGYLNGHTPFSAIVAFSALTAAYMNDIKYVVLSNEASANESTVKGSEVNHQYSKSFRFENDLHQYEKNFIGSGVYYFSLLRPMSELQIAENFARYEQYHSVFRSCNAGSKTDVWCGGCPKCLFVAVILSPFLDRSRLADIFGRDMLDDPKMEGHFRQLIGLTPEKPFECVGSRDEINTAVTRAINRYEQQGQPLPLLYEKYKETPLFEEYRHKADRYGEFFEEQNLLPEYFRRLLLKNCYGGKGL